MEGYKASKKLLKKLGFEKDSLTKDWGLDITSSITGDYTDSIQYLQVTANREKVSLSTFKESGEGDMVTIWFDNIGADEELKKLVRILTI